MAAPQTSVAASIAGAFDGQLASSGTLTIESAIAVVDLTAGKAVAIDSTSGAFPVLKVSVPNNSADKILGIVLNDTGKGPDQLTAGRAVEVLTKGKVWVTPAVSVTPGQLAYAVPTTGALTNTDNSGANILIGRWLGNGGTSTRTVLEVAIP